MSEYNLPKSTRRRKVTLQKPSEAKVHVPEVLGATPSQPQRGLTLKEKKGSLNLSEEGVIEIAKEGVKVVGEIGKGIIQIYQTRAEIERIKEQTNANIKEIEAQSAALRSQVEGELMLIRGRGEILKNKGQAASDILKDALDRIPAEDRAAALPIIREIIRDAISQ